MAQELRTKFLEQEVRLSKSEVELERLKNERLRIVIKNGVERHFATRSKESKMSFNVKLDELEKLRAEVGAKDRLDGFEQKISRLEMANLKLSTSIKNLISETEREVYGKATTNTEQNKLHNRKFEDLNRIVQQLSDDDVLTNAKPSRDRSKHTVRSLRPPMLSVTPRSQNRDSPKPQPSMWQSGSGTARSSAGRTKQNVVGLQRPSTTTIANHPKTTNQGKRLEGHSLSNRTTPHAAKDSLPIRRDVNLKCPTTMLHQQFEKDGKISQYCNIRRQISSNLYRSEGTTATPTRRKPLATQVAMPRSGRTGQGHEDTFGPLRSTKSLSETTQKSPTRVILARKSPRSYKDDRMKRQDGKLQNHLSIDLTLLDDKTKQEAKIGVCCPEIINSERSSKSNKPSSHGQNKLEINAKRPLVNMNEASHLESVFQRQSSNLNPQTGNIQQASHQYGDTLRDCLDLSPRMGNKQQTIHQEGDIRQRGNVSPRNGNIQGNSQQNEALRQLLINLTPRSINLTDSVRGPKSTGSASETKIDKPRPWYERLPLPDVDAYLSDGSGERYDGCYSDSDSSGTKPIVSAPIRRQSFDDGMFLGDGTALMPRPVIRKSCKLYIGNLENLTDEEAEMTADNSCSRKSKSCSLTPRQCSTSFDHTNDE